MNQSRRILNTPCPEFTETITVNPERPNKEAIRLAKQCRRLGQNRTEGSPIIVQILTATVVVFLMWLVFDASVEILKETGNNELSLLAILAPVTQKMLPACSALLVIAFLFSFQIKTDFTNPPLGGIANVTLSRDRLNFVRWIDGHPYKYWSQWGNCSVKWSDEAWLISVLHRNHVLIPAECLSASQQAAFQEFIEQLNAWKFAGNRSDDQVAHEVAFNDDDSGGCFKFTADHAPRLLSVGSRLRRKAHSPGLAAIVFAPWFLRTWSIVLALCVLTFPGIVWHLTGQLFVASALPGLFVSWLIYRLSQRIAAASSVQAGHATGIIRANKIEIQTPDGGSVLPLAGLEVCQYSEGALILEWPSPDVSLILLPECFRSAGDWKQCCHQIETAFRAG